MISGQWHISPNSEPRNGSGGGTWYPASSVIVQATTDVEITDLSIPIIQYDPYNDMSFDVDVDVDGVRVFHETVLLTGELNKKIFYDVSPNVRADRGSTLSISATVAPVNHSLSQYDTRATAVLPWGGSTNSPVLEVIISGSYAPAWTIDGQNDGYPYPINTNPTKFTEFTKDRDGYPTNLSVWKLDENNEGYPWTSGFNLIRREVLMKFINDTVLNNLVQKINSIFRINSHNNIEHTDLNVRKLDAQKIDINGATRIETTNSGVIKLGNTLTHSNTNTSVLSILNDEVTVKHSLDSYNIKSRWISRHVADGGLTLSYYSQSETNSLTGFPFLILRDEKIVISGNGDLANNETSPYITVDGDNNRIRLDSHTLSIYSDVTIKNKLSILDYLTVYNDGNMMFRTSDKSIGMYTESDRNDISDLDGEKIRLSNTGLITLCGRNYIRIGISQTLNVTPVMSTFYETIVAHYGVDHRWLYLTCPNSNVTLQLETDKAYYTKTDATRTANDEIATIGDILTSLSGYIPNVGNTTTGNLTLSRSGNIGITSTGGDILIKQTTGGTKSITIECGEPNDIEKINLDENGVKITNHNGVCVDVGQTESDTLSLLGSASQSMTFEYDGDIFIDAGTNADINIATINSGQTAYYKGTTANNEIATIGDITSRIQESDAMQYKGSINASADLPTVSNTTNNVKVGATYKVATAGSYSYYNGTATVTQSCKVGDLFIAKAIASGTTKTITWDYIPAADDVLALSYITSGTPTISTTAQTGTSLTLGSVVTKMFETTLTNTDANVPTSKAVQTYVSGGYIPNAGNSDSNISFNLSRDDISLNYTGEFILNYDGYPRINTIIDGVEIVGDNTNTKISVGYDGVDDIYIHAEDGSVTFVTDNITLQSADREVTIGGDTEIKIYAGDIHDLTLESTGITNIKASDEIIIDVASNNVPALSFSTGCDVNWFNQPAVLSVYGSGLNSWNNFVNNVISASNNTHFKFGVENRTINIAANTTITNDNNASDYDNVLRFVNCTFNITNGNAFVEISGGKVEFENCNFVAPNYVNNKVSVTDYAYAVFKNCTFENVDVECKTDDNGAVFIMENCYCSHTLFLEPLENPTAPFKIINSYFDSNTFTIPTGETAINAIVTGCRFSPNTSLSNVRRSWNNTLY